MTSLSPNPPTQRSGRADPAARSGTTAGRRPIRVLVGDSDREFRRVLRKRFAADPRIDLVGEADDGVLALQLVRCLRPDVALLDGDLPPLGGAAVERALASELPEVRVMVRTRSLAGVRR
jgi:chemotaxis response regulator CheB